MQKTLEEIDKIRKKGFRPQVVGCFLYSKKLLMVYKKEHNLWQLPQGGVDNKETMDEALVREMSEELGSTFIDRCDIKSMEIITGAKVEFPFKKQGVRNLRTDSGDEVTMKGKKYFFFAVTTSDEQISLEKTEFDDSRWVTSEEALELAEKIYQKGKKRMTVKAIDKLRELHLIN